MHFKTFAGFCHRKHPVQLADVAGPGIHAATQTRKAKPSKNAVRLVSPCVVRIGKVPEWQTCGPADVYLRQDFVAKPGVGAMFAELDRRPDLKPSV